jgi:hypothetical protein
LQFGPWLGYTGKPIGGVQIPARGLTGGEGEVRGNVQELTAVTGVVGVGKERDCGGVSTANRDGRRSSEGCLSVLNRLPTKGYTQGGKFWVRGRRDQELEGAKNTRL